MSPCPIAMSARLGTLRNVLRCSRRAQLSQSAFLRAFSCSGQSLRNATRPNALMLNAVQGAIYRNKPPLNSKAPFPFEGSPTRRTLPGSTYQPTCSTPRREGFICRKTTPYRLPDRLSSRASLYRPTSTTATTTPSSRQSKTLTR